MSIRARFLFLPAAALLLLFGSAPSATFSQDRTTSGTASLDAEGTVVVDNHEGSVSIETWGRAEVKYEAVVRPESDAEHPEATVVRVDRGNDRFVLHTEHDESKKDGDGSGLLDRLFGGTNQNLMPVEYTLTVPRTARLEIDDHESEIQVQGLSGLAAIDTHDGTITLTDQGGRAELDSHDGSIRVKNQTGALAVDTHDGRVELTGQDGDAEIESHDGPIRVENHAGAVAIDTHDSDIEAEGLRGGLEVDTHEGSGRFAFAALTDDVDVTTKDGNFTVTLPAGTGFDLRTDFDDEDASLRADFDLSPYRISMGDDDDEVNYTGSVNGGGPGFFFSADDGDFEIRRQ